MKAATRIQVIESLDEVSADEWNALDLQGNPTLRHEFLAAFEHTHCAISRTGWRAQHLLLRSQKGALVAAMPLYLKPHSWGEFVFDFGWASAYQRHGARYYPKLTSCIPFTPATGNRLLVSSSDQFDAQSLRNELVKNALDLMREESLSSLHCLFTTRIDQAVLEAFGCIARVDCQFHWNNHRFQTFDDFIATFRADKRKKALRERRRIAEEGIHFVTLTGAELSDEQWRIAMHLSEQTFRSHGHEHYLNVDFFREVSQKLPASIVVKFAMKAGDIIATAIFFRGDDTLYGRYWGAEDAYNSLHFEACYYQGIDYCIANGIQRFEPGTQGEHKIARGFVPTKTTSAHFIADQRFAHAIREHVQQERKAIDAYIHEVNQHLPFHRETLLS